MLDKDAEASTQEGLFSSIRASRRKESSTGNANSGYVLLRIGRGLPGSTTSSVSVMESKLAKDFSDVKLAMRTRSGAGMTRPKLDVPGAGGVRSAHARRLNSVVLPMLATPSVETDSARHAKTLNGSNAPTWT